jgi:MinD-like ATPase involved in chromosome partitioning or flagellar assembly
VYTITFYSFKGGVGRTLALVNVGAELAHRGRRVLLVDFDLEAPGLTNIELLRPAKSHPGLVEYTTEYLRTDQVPLVTDYLYEVKGPFIGKNKGSLWVMPAGRGDEHYRKSLARLDWQSLYRDHEGFLFFEETKLEWEEFVKPDYVLIDARTGHTDIEGICTRQLPDAVVVMFFPNEQNLTGLKQVGTHIRAEKDGGLRKDIKLNFVMSNVPDLDDEDKTLRRLRQRFTQDVCENHPPLVIHHYQSMSLLNQAVFVKERPHSRLAKEYRKLTGALILGNPKDEEAPKLFRKDLTRLMRSLSARDPEFTEDHLDRALEAMPQLPFLYHLRADLRVESHEVKGAWDDLMTFLKLSDSAALVEATEKKFERFAGLHINVKSDGKVQMLNSLLNYLGTARNEGDTECGIRLLMMLIFRRGFDPDLQTRAIDALKFYVKSLSNETANERVRVVFQKQYLEQKSPVESSSIDLANRLYDEIWQRGRSSPPDVTDEVS